MEPSQYITVRRTRFKAINGDLINIPWGTPIERRDGILLWDGLPLCTVTSQNAHDYFARNDDGHGLERGRLISAITGQLAKRDQDYQARWDLVWSDRLCRRYRQRDHADYWLWDHKFFEAILEDLKHIADLVGCLESRGHE